MIQLKTHGQEENIKKGIRDLQDLRQIPVGKPRQPFGRVYPEQEMVQPQKQLIVILALMDRTDHVIKLFVSEKNQQESGPIVKAAKHPRGPGAGSTGEHPDKDGSDDIGGDDFFPERDSRVKCQIDG